MRRRLAVELVDAYNNTDSAVCAGRMISYMEIIELITKTGADFRPLYFFLKDHLCALLSQT
jgi:hypothetical protein